MKTSNVSTHEPARLSNGLTAEQIGVLAEFAKCGRLRAAALHAGVDPELTATWCNADPVFVKAYASAKATYNDVLVSDYMCRMRVGFEKNADAIAWMFAIKQADPSFRDAYKLQVEAGQAVRDILADIQGRVKRRVPRPPPPTPGSDDS